MNSYYHLPVRPYSRFLAWVLRRLQRRCQHWALKADIIEGCAAPYYAVRWCETCGAICTVIDGTPTPMRSPEPTWEQGRRPAWAGERRARAAALPGEGESNG
jgi:hypothetical protein